MATFDGTRHGNPGRSRVAKQLPSTNGSDLARVAVEHQALVDRACAQRLGPGPDAEDARQEGAVRVLERGVADDVARAWETAARHETYRRWRQVESHGDELAGLLLALGPEVDPEDVVVGDGTAAEILAALTPLQRDAVLARWQGYSLSEAAWLRRISLGAFATRLREAKRRLRDLGIGVGAGLAELLRRLRRRRPAVRGDVALALRFVIERVAAIMTSLDSAAVQLIVPVLAGAILVGSATPASSAPALSRHTAASPTRSSSHARPFGINVDQPPGWHTSQPSRLPVPPRDADNPLGFIRGDRHETIDDTQLLVATTAYHSTPEPIIVGLGYGATCNCLYLWRSLDGGATWEKQAEPTLPLTTFAYRDANIALPPAYPADPRIFVGFPPQLGAVDFSTSSFDQPLAPLPVPPGHIAVSAALDAGDDRFFVSTTSGVLADNLASGEISQVMTNAASGAPALIATPYGTPDGTVLMVATQGPTILPPTQLVAAPTLVSCSALGPCSSLASTGLPSPVYDFLSLSPFFGQTPTVVIGASNVVAISYDGGRAFSVGPTVDLGTIAVSLDVGNRLWRVVGVGTKARLQWSADGMTWRDVTANGDVLDRPGIVLSASDGAVLDVVVDVGLRCSLDTGVSWHVRC